MVVDQALRTDIMRENQALRQWARSLRDRGVQARADAAATRAAHPTRVQSRVGPPADRSPDEAILPSLGDVSVLELLEILVDVHGFGVVQAVRAVAKGLYACGYPADHDRVVAADAFDIVDMATRET